MNKQPTSEIIQIHVGDKYLSLLTKLADFTNTSPSELLELIIEDWTDTFAKNLVSKKRKEEKK